MRIDDPIIETVMMEIAKWLMNDKITTFTIILKDKEITLTKSVNVVH
jgi:hypothetical protein